MTGSLQLSTAHRTLRRVPPNLVEPKIPQYLVDSFPEMFLPAETVS